MRSVVNKHIDNQKDKKKCSYSTDPEASNVLKISTKKNNTRKNQIVETKPGPKQNDEQHQERRRRKAAIGKLISTT